MFLEKAYMPLENTIEEDLPKLGLRNAYGYLGTEASHGFGLKNEKEKQKKECLGSLRFWTEN
jgi:hypothetical protein